MSDQPQNLVIDIGNSRTKYGLFAGGELVQHGWLEDDPVTDLQHLAYNHSVQKIIISSTGMTEDRLLQAFADFRVVLLHADTPQPLRLDYRTPETLGRDRLAAAVGAHHVYPDQHCLVIDAGTCITYDLLTADGTYHGGNIAPGLRMRLQAMHRYTARLPEVEPGDRHTLVGKSTEEALRNGAQWGIAFEWEGYIRALEAEFHPLSVVATGGDADFFEKFLKRKIFVNSHLVLVGLNQILEHNA